MSFVKLHPNKYFVDSTLAFLDACKDFSESSVLQHVFFRPLPSSIAVDKPITQPSIVIFEGAGINREYWITVTPADQYLIDITSQKSKLEETIGRLEQLTSIQMRD